MSTAQRIFIAYGTAILIVGFGLGTVLGMLRLKMPAVRNLATAHVETLMQAAMHLTLAFAVGAVGFDSGAATLGAWLLVASSGAQALGVMSNWVLEVADGEQAAELVGVMSAALDITVEYIKTRKQFGKPIGSFQALQHRAVNDYAKMISARSFVFQVAAQGPTISTLMAAAVKAHAVAEALEVTKSAIQMHGGIGFTEDCDIGLFLKRAMWHSAWLGNAAEHRARYAAAMA